MKVSVVTPNRNGGRYLADCIRSVQAQRADGLEVEYILADGCSTDNSLEVAGQHRAQIDRVIVERDTGPASALNKAFRQATGDLLAWINADDVLCPGSLRRSVEALQRNPGKALAFGRCRIVDEDGREIRQAITRFKELFFPFAGRFTLQTINFLSQPGLVFRREALEKAGPIREDIKAAWDYEFFLRLWRQGGAVRVPGPPLADFRWHPGSISGQHYRIQFQEELRAAMDDAGRWPPQALLHRGVRWGIVTIYTRMARRRKPGG